MKLLKTRRLGIVLIGIGALLLTAQILMDNSEGSGLNRIEIALIVGTLASTFGGIGLIFWSNSEKARGRTIRVMVPICGFMFCCGIAFKFFEIPSAAIQLILGSFMLTFIIGPVVARNRYEKWHSFATSKAGLLGIMITDSLGFGCLGLGITFWFQHWPGAQGLVIAGLFLTVLSSLLWNRSIDKLFKVQVNTSRDLKVANQSITEAHSELTEKNREILDSINYAKRIQTAILPPNRIVKEYLHNSFILYKPKDVVAGDFYWMEAVGEVVYFAAADCTGHGVPGAMVSVICNTGLNRSVREFGLRKPAEILDKTRELVIAEFAKSEEDVMDGMDISLCALNTKTNALQWAGANNPLWIVSSNTLSLPTSTPPHHTASEPHFALYELKADKQPIGNYGALKPFTNHEIALAAGDTIYIFSDGYPDQFGGESGKKYKSGKFKRTLLELSQKPISEQREWLDQEFESWRGSLEQIDDVCVIGVKV